MGKDVKIIADKLDANEITVIQKYIQNIRQIINDEISVTILDSNYKSDYNVSMKHYDEIISKNPGVKIDNFYITHYLQSQEKNNINKFTKEYMRHEQFTSEKKKNGQRAFIEDGHVRVLINLNKAGTITNVDFFQKNQKNPHQRAFINSSGNIQCIRHFNVQKKIPTMDEYLDTNLRPYIMLKYDKKGLCSSYEFVNEVKRKFYSEIDLYEEWFNRVIKKEDYVINLNRHFDIIFRQKYAADRLFLM